jgi:hypothetical protein
VADVTRVVETVFRGKDEFSPAAKEVEKSAGMLGSLANFSLVAQGAGMLFNAIKSVTGAVLDLNVEMQNTRLAIAGNLTAFGVTKDMASGITVANEALKEMRRLAAPLPGEVQDYVEVFRTALPKAIESGMSSVKDIATLTSNYAAVAIANQVDAMQAGRDLQMMLGGRAGMHVRTWTILQAHIGKTSEEFNKMNARARRESIEKAIAKYQPLLEAFSNTWDAKKGAFLSGIKQITLGATAPLFENATNSLAKMNVWLTANSEKLTDMGITVSETIVRGFSMAATAAERLASAMQKGAGLFSAGGGSSGMGRLQHANDVAQGNDGNGGAGLLSGLAGRTGALAATITSLGETFDILTGVAAPLVNALGTLGDLLGEAVATLLPPFMDGVNNLLRPLAGFASYALDIVSVFTNYVRPMFMNLVTSVGKLWEGLTQVLGPAFTVLGAMFLKGAEVVGDKLAPVLETVVGWFQKVTDALAEFFKMLGGKIKDSSIYKTSAGMFDAHTGRRADIAGLTSQDDGSILSDGSGTSDAGFAPKPNMGTPKLAAGGARAGQVYDFRYSRFDIKQEFEKGFDPDRIAVSMARDFARAGNMRTAASTGPGGV